MKEYAITAIRGSVSLYGLWIQVDLTTLDINQKFLNMDEGNGKTLEIVNNTFLL